jgi:hypothetical protein
MASDPRIPCSACQGHGERDLPAPYRETLSVLGRIGPGWIATGRLLPRHRTPVAPTALINRLNALVRWGLVDRRGTGRGIEWRRI